ncbi:NUDIX hydrolase [uncultured Mucilaginibacter sp.]|uniref:NUDIX hydrolase n=1 Tax=uncultured Mucilaginibacter sp. TaxID=797541 RepID=UPI0025DA9766|nr:NUDIX hydrolase [uncultured Mucilaginibacter sp.]
MYFNVRVYGLLINHEQEVLLTDEQVQGYRFTKFPGGGVEFGEGLSQALKREFMEECNTEVDVMSHFYTTDFFVKSAFNDSQIISVYYLVKAIGPLNFAVKTKAFDFDGDSLQMQSFRWEKISNLTPQNVTFPIDQYVVELLKEQK